MKSWQLSDKIREDAGLAALVNNSQTTLEEIVGPFSQDLVDARWDVSTQGNRTTLWLALSDWTCPDGKRIALSPADLTSDSLPQKFNRLWGDLLQARSHEQLRELQRAVQEL